MKRKSLFLVVLVLLVFSISKAQVKYVEVNQKATSGNDYILDLVNDGMTCGTMIFNQQFSQYDMALLWPIANTEIIAKKLMGLNVVQVIEPGTMIDSKVTDWMKGDIDQFCMSGGEIKFLMAINYGQPLPSLSPWQGVKNKYIGMKVQVGSHSGPFYYGWVEVSVSDDCKEITIHGYAYEQTPGKGIKAGDKTGAPTTNLYEHNKFNVSIYPNPTTDFVNVKSTENFTYEVYNLVGQKIISNETPSNYANIDFKSYPKGQYIIKLQNENTVVNKMIVVE